MPTRRDLAWGALGVLAAAIPLAYLRGFTVDDALIPARYAAHLARGLGYRFNAGGPASDGVTPLGFPYLLAPFAKGGPLAALAAARLGGALAWLAAAFLLGRAVARASSHPARFAALLLVVASAPLAAWAVSGLETALATALATVAAVAPKGRRTTPLGALAAGLVAWLRPEMIAWALVLGLGRARESEGRARKALAVALAASPWLVVVALRIAAFGRPAPLAVLAKPSDLAHGVAYAGACALLAGGPIAVLDPLAWRRLRGFSLALLAGAAVHLVVIVAVGGDWMPLSRLVVPVLPSLALVAAELVALSPRLALARIGLAVAGEVFAFAKAGPAAAGVADDRAALIAWARPRLGSARSVAALDVGWVGAATEADVIDLAGVTDLEIASLPGGHTSKAISGAWLAGRAPDALVFQLRPGADPGDPAYARRVEHHLAHEPAIASRYAVVAASPAGLPVRYVVLSPVEGAAGR